MSGATDAWLDGANLGIRLGDPLLFVSGSIGADGWNVRTVTAVEPDQAAARTHVTWDAALDDFDAAPAEAVFVFRKRVALFGHNAPVWAAMGTDYQGGYVKQFDPDAAVGDEWPFFEATTASGTQVIVDLDGSHPDIVVGSFAPMDHGDHHHIYTVASKAELSRSAFAVWGRSRAPHARQTDQLIGTPRDAAVLAVPEALTLVEAPDESPLDVATVLVEGDASAMRPGRTVLMVGSTAAGQTAQPLVIEEATASGPRTQLTFTTEPAGFDRATASVFGNIAHATHGETVAQLLGWGMHAAAFQSAVLARGPLTFVAADTPRGAASTLGVRVDDIAWTEVPTTAIAAARDRVFETRDEPDGRVSVVFGDGEHGARPSTGTNNLRATYRVGTGIAGNVAADALSTPLDRPLGLKAVTNPLAATGGVDPETAVHARRSIPVAVLTLGRVVSLSDYADFALAFTGIGKAAATLLHFPAGATVVVTVGGRRPARCVDHRAARLRARPIRRPWHPSCRRAGASRGLPCRAQGHDRPVARARPCARGPRGAAARTVRGIRPVDRDRLPVGAHRGGSRRAGGCGHRSGSATRGSSRAAAADRAGGAGGFGSVVLGAQLLALSDAPFDWLQEVPS